MKEISDLSWYFPDFREGQLPEREYLWNVLYTLKPNETGQLIKDAREKRSVSSSAPSENLVEIAPDLLQKLKELKPQKRMLSQKL